MASIDTSGNQPSGLLSVFSGLAQGVGTAMNLVQTQKLVEHRQRMAELAAGVERDANGNLVPNAQKQQEMGLQRQHMETQGLLEQRAKDSLDPTSDVSAHGRALARAAQEQAKPGSSKFITDDLSLKDLEEGGFLNTGLKGQYGLLTGQAKADAIAAPRQQMANIAMDNQTSQAVDRITKDPELEKHVSRLQGANRMLDQLADVRSGKMVDTKQFLGDLNTEYVNMLTGSNNAALGKQERTEYKTGAAGLAGILQEITAHPESIHSPEILNQLETGIRGMQRSYQNVMRQRGQLLQRDYKHNPDAVAAQRDATKTLLNQYGADQQAPAAGLINPAGAAGAPPVDPAKMTRDEKIKFLQGGG